MNVDITSSLTGLLGSKANSNGNTYTGNHDFTGATVSGVSSTIADGSLTIAKTSGLQSALDLKSNLDGNTYTGTHDFSGATVSGVTAGPVLVYTTRTITGNGTANSINASPLYLESTDINKVVRFVTDIALSVILPPTTGVPDGTWIGISCSSRTTARVISIFNNTGQTNNNGQVQVLGGFNANPPGVASGGNGKQLIVIGGVWVALGN
jgi:hypothetical protein